MGANGRWEERERGGDRERGHQQHLLFSNTMQTSQTHATAREGPPRGAAGLSFVLLKVNRE